LERTQQIYQQKPLKSNKRTQGGLIAKNVA